METRSPSEKIAQLAEQDARIRKVSLMLAKDGNSRERIDEACENARRYCRENGVTGAILAKRIGVSPSEISSLFSPQRWEKLKPERATLLAQQANDEIENIARERDARAPVGFVEHSASRRLIGSAHTCKKLGCIGLAFGPSGIGKTTTARFLASDDSPLPGTGLVEVADDERSAGGLRWAIHEAFRSRRGAREIVRMSHLTALLARSGRLLLIDQAHLLKDSGFQTLMSLHDKTGIPILMVGTSELRAKTESTGDGDRWIGQLSSRIGWRQSLYPWSLAGGEGDGQRRAPEWVRIDELRKMLDCKLRFHPEALAKLLPIACFSPGRLREAWYTARLAEAAARGDQRDQVSAADVADAIEERRKALHGERPQTQGARRAEAVG